MPFSKVHDAVHCSTVEVNTEHLVGWCLPDAIAVSVLFYSFGYN